MRIPKWLAGRTLAVALALTMVPAALPSTTPLVGVSSAKADPYYRYGPHYGPGGFRGAGWGGQRYYGGRGYYGGPRYYGGRGYGYGHRGYRVTAAAVAAVAGAIVGLGVGAAIASAAQPRYVERARATMRRRPTGPNPGRASGIATAPSATAPSIRGRALPAL